MKTYSVKQIAEMLSTNPETVRRWIRTNKLQAVQDSRKQGNIISSDALEKFIKTTPKYLTKIPVGAGLTVVPPIIGIATLAGGIVASFLLGYLDENKDDDFPINPKMFRDYLEKSKKKLKANIQQKNDLICQTEAEIFELSKQLEQYEYLLEHESLLETALEKATTNLEE